MNASSTANLSEREKEVAALLLQGKSNKQIARALGVATRTVEFHTSNIYAKLGVSSRAEAIVMLSQAHLRESTGAELRPATGALRASTVDPAAVLTENGENLKPVFRRNRMSKFWITMIIIAAAALIGTAVLTAMALSAGLVTWNSYREVTSAGSAQIEAEPTYTPYAPTFTPVAPTRTPIQPTPTPYQPTRTPIVPTPTPDNPFAITIITTLSPVQAADGRYIYEGVGFAQEDALASSASGSVIAAKPANPDGSYFETYPQHVRIALDGYPIEGTFRRPMISVYPVEEYRASSPQNAEQLDRLADLLANRPADPERLPVLPLANAGLTFQAGVEYFDFQNGSGVRYLGILAQYPAPVNNDDLTYTFLGLTDDGRHFISIVMPIQHPAVLESANDQTQAEFEAMLAVYDQYRAEAAAALEAQPPASFIPGLDRLDALSQSVMIDR